MRLLKTLVASAALVASLGANATVTGGMGGGLPGSFLTLSSAGLSGGAVATLTGGAVFPGDLPFADQPFGSVSNFLAAGPAFVPPVVGSPSATLAFTGSGVSLVSFLWGSPDLYNLLTVHSSSGADQTFTAAGLGFPVTNGNQGFSQYVRFQGVGADKILSLTFSNVPAVNAFEVTNFTITPVPEPETYALMLAGLGAVGFVARRRKSA